MAGKNEGNGGYLATRPQFASLLYDRKREDIEAKVTAEKQHSIAKPLLAVGAIDPGERIDPAQPTSSAGAVGRKSQSAG